MVKIFVPVNEWKRTGRDCFGFLRNQIVAIFRVNLLMINIFMEGFLIRDEIYENSFRKCKNIPSVALGTKGELIVGM